MTTPEITILCELADQHVRTAELLRALAHTKEDGDQWMLAPRARSRTRTTTERCPATGFSRSRINTLKTEGKPVEGKIRIKHRANRLYYSVKDALEILNNEDQ